MSSVDVDYFGAMADGKTDDSAALQTAYDSAKDGDQLVLHPGTYRVAKPLNWIGTKRVDIAGRAAMLYYAGKSGTAVSWGAPVGHSVQFARWSGVRIVRSLNWSDESTGLMVQNVRNATIDAEQIYGFKRGVILRGDQEACAYGRMRIAHLCDCQTMLATESIGAGWVNCWTMHDTSMTCPSGEAGPTFVDLTRADRWQPEDWVFDHCGFESNRSGVMKTRGLDIVFRECRWETNIGKTEWQRVGTADVTAERGRQEGFSKPSWLKIGQ